jgi:hypothetical protein
VRARKYYGYFGPTPALLRLQWIALDLGFGRWSRLGGRATGGLAVAPRGAYGTVTVRGDRCIPPLYCGFLPFSDCGGRLGLSGLRDFRYEMAETRPIRRP